MRASFGWIAIAVAACYSPSPPTGATCANGVCPDPLVCSPATNTCEHQAVGGDGATDALATDGTLADAAHADAAADAPPVASFAGLDGQQWLLPCTGSDNSNGLCPCGMSSHKVQLVTASPELYDVSVRVRAVSEGGTYAGGSAGAGEWYVGGAPGSNFLTVLELDVSSPMQHYYLNAGSGIPNVIDYTVTLPIESDAQLTLFATGQDGLEEPNKTGSGSAIVVPGVSTPQSPYNGEFAQINVVSAVPVAGSAGG